MDCRITYRMIKSRLFGAGIIALTALSVVPLILILFFLIRNGFSVVNATFLTGLPRPVGVEGGGIANAIVGTLMLIAVSSVFAVPLGIAAGMYLSESRESRFSDSIRLCVEVLQSTPSIVIGIAAYVWLVIPMGHFSALSGGVALGLIMLPLVITTTEEVLTLIPQSLKEASLALGVPYYRTMLVVVMQAGMSGILSGILLGIARIAGETAPLLFTAFGNPFMSASITQPVNALPLVIFNYATSPYKDWQTQAWGASFVLIVIVLGLNILTKLISQKWKAQF